MAVTTVPVLPATTAPRRTPPPSPPHRRTSPTATILLLLGAAYCLLPVLWVLIASTKSAAELFNTFTFAPSTHLFDNIGFLTSYRDGLFWRWMANTALYAGVGAAASTLVSASAGFALAKYDFRGKSFVFNVVLAGVLVPGVILAVPQYLLLAKVGMTNTYWAVLLPSMISPYGIYLARIFAAATVPNEVLEAARMDGAGEWYIFWRIVMPLVKPALATLSIFTFLGSWNNFVWPLIATNDPDKYTLPVALATFATDPNKSGGSNGMLMAGSFLIVLPVLVVFIALQRHFTQGIATAGMK